MSQMVTRKSGGTDEKEKEKSQTDNTVKDMKKKMAANAEKEKQTTEKPTEKQPEKNDKSKPVEKPAEKTKAVEKPVEKPKATEKPAEKPKTVEKPAEKPAEKKVESKDKKDLEKKEDKPEKNGKSEGKKNGNEKPKQNGSKHNGESNGVDDTASSEDEEEFPELTYEESDTESPGNSVPSRSQTRRSQVKPTRTPETPQPAPDKPAEGNTTEESKDSKVLKLNEAPPSNDRKLRSADSPKPESKKEDKKKGEEKENGEDVIIEIEDDEPGQRKTDTNFSKSRVKVSPYRRSTRLADQTTTSLMANYTGNNTTMEMDITESSILSDDGTLNDSSYLSGLRSIRGRRSYKPLKEMTLRHVVNRSTASNTNTDSTTRPTAPVVGRKRKPESDHIELALEASETSGVSEASGVLHGKRMRLLERIAMPFRRTVASTPLPARRNAEIVGLNTDLPLTAPVSPPVFDPESLKQLGDVTPPSPAAAERDNKRCVVM